jgi:hypothetical protein
MDSSDGLVDGEVYQAHESIVFGCAGGQRAGEQQEMVDVSITARTEVRRAEKRKCLWTGGSLSTQGGTLTNAKLGSYDFL